MESAATVQTEARTDPLRELVLEAQEGDSSAVAALWTEVEKFVRWQARRRFRAVGSMGGCEVDDLVQEGFIAFAQAINDYDPARGNFLTLLNYNLLTAFAVAEGMRGKDPLNGAASLDEPLSEIYGDDAEQTRADLIPDQRAEAAFTDVEERLFTEDLRKALFRALDALSPAQRQIIKARYYEGHTLKRVGEECGFSASRAREIEGAALRQLRRQAKMFGLEQFVTQHTIYFYHYGVATMEHTGTSPVEASVLQRERLEKLWESEKMYTVLS